MEKKKASDSQKYKLKRFVKELENFRGRGTELVSVYIPAGYDLNKINTHISEEQGTAANIKSKQTRENVIAALEKIIQHLKLFPKTPENGLALFAGNVAEREGQQDYQVWSIEPPLPLNQRLYRCDKEFVLEPLRDMVEDKESYGLIVMDRREANIALLKGKNIIPLVGAESMVPGKFRAGGQCLSKESIVFMSNGVLEFINDVEVSSKVKSVLTDKKYDVVDSRISDKWVTKKSKEYRIITKNPRTEICCSKDHLFFVYTSEGIMEKPAEKLKEDDYLVMPEKIGVKGKKQRINSRKYYNNFVISEEGRNVLKYKRIKEGFLQRELAKKADLTQSTISSYELGKINVDRRNLSKLCKTLSLNPSAFMRKHLMQSHYRNTSVKLPDFVSGELAQFLGYLLGDGCVEEDRISFFEQDKEVAIYYKKKFDSYFSITAHYRFRESKNYHQLRFTSRPLVRMIREEFPEIMHSNNSLIPRKILLSEDKVLARFLTGLFDAEGYVNKRKAASLGMNNKHIIRQLQMALLRFGILSSVYEYDNNRNIYSSNPRFTLDIHENKSLRLFAKHIGFTSKKKMRLLQEKIKDKTSRNLTRQIIVPGKAIRKLIENKGYNTEHFPTVTNFFRNERMMGKETFKSSIMGFVKDKQLLKKLKEIMECPVIPVKISNIQVTSRKSELVDISVTDRNFIANGLLVHNSAQRFARNRELAAKDFYQKIGFMAKEQFFEMKDLKGIIVGGPGPTKYEFVDGNYLATELKNKVIGIRDLSYTDEFGLQELLEKSQDLLAEESVVEEKKLMNKFFDLLAKNPGMVSYGRDECKRLLEMGAVDVLLVSEGVDDKVIDEFSGIAEGLGTKMEVVSLETREGVQLKDLGGFAAILRYNAGESY